MGSDPKMPIAPRVIIGRLKLPAALPTSIPEGKASTMSWND